MNFRLRRFIETTLPMIIGFGLSVVVVTKLFGFGWGIICIIIFSIVDITMTTRTDVIPRNIQYEGKYFRTLTELINYVKKSKQ